MVAVATAQVHREAVVAAGVNKAVAGTVAVTEGAIAAAVVGVETVVDSGRCSPHCLGSRGNQNWTRLGTYIPLGHIGK